MCLSGHAYFRLHRRLHRSRIWLFAGIPVGIWFRFAGRQNRFLQQDHFAIESVAAYMMFFIIDVLESLMCPGAAELKT